MNIFTSLYQLNAKFVINCGFRDMFSIPITKLNIFLKPILRILNEHILTPSKILLPVLLAVLSVICLPTSSLAQDIHFSQYYNSPLTTNPALTGIFRGDIRAYGIYRSQWNAASVPFKTSHVAVDGKIFPKKILMNEPQKGFFSVGGQFFHDEAGDSNLRMDFVGLNGSYTLALDRENFLTVGLGVGIGQRKFDIANLSWDNQFQGDEYNSGLPSNENFNNDNRMFPDASIGVNWHGMKQDRRSTMDVGFAVFHPLTPKQNFYSNDDARLPVRLSLYILPTIQVGEKSDLVFHGTAQIQDKYLEALGGGAFRYYVNSKKTKEVAVQLGFSWRLNSISDAAVIAAELQYRYLNIGFSYDINVSEFQEATNRNGGPELSARYVFHKVRSINHYKVCPLL